MEQAAAAYAGKGYTEAEIGGEGYLKYQAEETALKSSQSIYPQYDRTSPATEPYHVSKSGAMSSVRATGRRPASGFPIKSKAYRKTACIT